MATKPSPTGFESTPSLDRCKECGKHLENTPSGLFSLCPAGHGKLMPPIMPKPFDVTTVPGTVAVCPECGDAVEVECNEWTMVDGVSRPTQGGLLISCSGDDPLGFLDEDHDEDSDHHYMQCEWIAVHQKIYKWLEAVK